MPELPEVETVKRGIEPAMVGDTIAQAIVRRPDLRWPFPKNMAERLTGAGVIRLRRRSKYILADLDTDETLLIHLGMSGRITVSGKAPGHFVRPIEPAQKHDHVVFKMRNGAVITFNDPRRFGAMDLLDTQTADDHPLLAKLGPEPLGNGFHTEQLAKAIHGKSAPIKSVLLDQQIVSGLGNIYVCEALHRAGISPKRAAGKISTSRLETLVSIIRLVLEEAIQAGGSSLQDHRQANGELGYFQHSFQVYDQEGQSCKQPNCAGEISRIVQSGRSTFYCPACQR